MRFFAKLAVIAGLAVMPLSMAGTALASPSVTSTPVTCKPWQTLDNGKCVDKPTGGGMGQGGQNNGDGYIGCPLPISTIPDGGPAARHFTPIDCYPKPDPKPYPKPDPQPWCDNGNHSKGGYDAIRGNVRDCQPQGGGWNWEQGQDNWYDPTNQDWYYPVSGWTGGYQDSSGCWHYPSQHGYQDQNYVYPQHHNYCRPEKVTFYFASDPNTNGTWLLENGGPFLHDGEALKYDGSTWTVRDWDPAGHGTLTPGGTGPYFNLVRGGYTLDGNVHQDLQYAHTVCFDGHQI